MPTTSSVPPSPDPILSGALGSVPPTPSILPTPPTLMNKRRYAAPDNMPAVRRRLDSNLGTIPEPRSFFGGGGSVLMTQIPRELLGKSATEISYMIKKDPLNSLWVEFLKLPKTTISDLAAKSRLDIQSTEETLHREGSHQRDVQAKINNHEARLPDLHRIYSQAYLELQDCEKSLDNLRKSKARSVARIHDFEFSKFSDQLKDKVEAVAIAAKPFSVTPLSSIRSAVGLESFEDVQAKMTSVDSCVSCIQVLENMGLGDNREFLSFWNDSQAFKARNTQAPLLQTRRCSLIKMQVRIADYLGLMIPEKVLGQLGVSSVLPSNEVPFTQDNIASMSEDQLRAFIDRLQGELASRGDN